MQYRDEIEQLLRCPVNWDDVFPNISDVQNTWHKLDWFYCLETVSFGGDDKRVVRASAEDDESVYERDGIDWREVRDNLKARRSEAVILYSNRASKLSNILYLRPSYNNKHYIPGDEEKILKQSNKNNNVSLFLEDYSSDQIRNGFSQWLINYFHEYSLAENAYFSDPFEDYVLSNNPDEALYQHPRARLWRKILRDHSIRIAFEAAYKVGYRAGAALDHICFDLEMSSNTIHAYPVSDEEAIDIMGDYSEVVLNKPAWW